MFKLLIVDDEEIIRQTIASLIDWSSLGVHLIGTCGDGVEAYHAILDESPDIVMTDIRMPGITGSELIERITQTDLHTKFIILTGYEEFEYAKRAMNCGVKHYLLKPCDEEQIISCVKDVVKELKQLLLTDEYQKNDNAFKKNLQYTLIQNMIREGISLPQITPSFFAPYEHYINLRDLPCQCCYLYFLEDKNLKEGLAAINTYFQKHAASFKIYQVYIQNTLIMFFPNYNLDYIHLDLFLKNLSFAGQTVSISYRRISYPDMLTLLETLITKLKRYDAMYFIEDQKMVRTFNYGNIILRIHQLVPDLLSEQKDEIFSELSGILESVSNIDFMKQLADNLLISLTTQISTNTLPEVTDFLYILHGKTDLNEIKKWTLEKVHQIINSQIQSTSHYSDFIEKLIFYIKEHVSEPNLTLKWISENYLYMNYNYVSRCFFKETGQKFSGYLMNYRIQKAKEIFASNDMEKIQNVASLVGCGNNPYYFSKIFKKNTGVTPSEYVRRRG